MLYPQDILSKRSTPVVRGAALFIFAVALLLSTNVTDFAQSQALNGQIEGTVTDPNGATIPNATVIIVNIETGTTRTVTTDDSGVYRAPLLPLGTYRVTAEAPNFKKLSLFLGRNTGRTPRQLNVDMRYSRFVRITERYSVEVFGEFINLFNIKSIFQVNGAVATDAAGNLLAPLPDFTTRNPSALDSRLFQLGIKFNF